MSAVVLAVWFALAWTWPQGNDPIVSVAIERGNAEQGRVVGAIYATANAAGPPVASLSNPGWGGQPASGYVSITTTPGDPFGWWHGGQAVRLLAVDAHGDTLRSNDVVIATVLPDTNFADGGRTGSWQRTTSGIYRHARAWGDSELTVPGSSIGPLLTQTAYTLTKLAAICAIFHRWAEAGLWRLCP